jgi:uncharacterized OsmC-like protein
MSDRDSTLKESVERQIKALTLRPSLGRGTGATKVTVRNGLTCEIEEGPWKLTADMSEKSGGNNLGPNPGFLGRGALGTCLAMSYVMWAAHLDFPLRTVSVDVEADYDACGHYGVTDVTPAYFQVRYIVTVETSAPHDDVIRFLDTVDARTPYLQVFAQPQDVRREVRVLAPQG